jgi:hypothetical protein
MPAARQLGMAIGYGWPGLRAPRERLTRTLSDALTLVYRVGFVEAQRELAALRARDPATAVTAATRRDTQPGAARRRFAMIAEDAAESSTGTRARVAPMSTACTIVQADTADFYALLAPAHCFGGGRYRGVMVFADGIRMVRASEHASRLHSRQQPIL